MRLGMDGIELLGTINFVAIFVRVHWATAWFKRFTVLKPWQHLSNKIKIETRDAAEGAQVKRLDHVDGIRTARAPTTQICPSSQGQSIRRSTYLRAWR